MQSAAPFMARLGPTETLRPTETLPLMVLLRPTVTLRPTENLFSDSKNGRREIG